MYLTFVFFYKSVEARRLWRNKLLPNERFTTELMSSVALIDTRTDFDEDDDRSSRVPSSKTNSVRGVLMSSSTTQSSKGRTNSTKTIGSVSSGYISNHSSISSQVSVDGVPKTSFGISSNQLDEIREVHSSIAIDM